MVIAWSSFFYCTIISGNDYESSLQSNFLLITPSGQNRQKKQSEGVRYC